MEGLSDIDMAGMRRCRDDTAISAVTYEFFTVAKGEYNQNEKDLFDRPSIIYLWGKNIKQRTTFTVGSQTLSANTYEPNGGNLEKTVFANGQYVQYTYDEFDRKIQAEYNTGRYIRYFYNAEGSVSRLTYGDGTTEKGSYQFEYDSLGRLIRSAEYDGGGNLIQRTEQKYDAYNRLSP